MVEDSLILTVTLAVLALIGGLIAAEIGRRGTRYAAELTAQQASREVQVSMLTDFIETVLDTSKAVQSYVFGVPKEQRRQRVHTDDWAEVQPLFEPALVGIHRARALSKSLIWPDISAAYETCDDFFFKLIRGTDEDAEWELWGETLYDQSDPITVVIELAGDKRREILLSYAA